MCAVINSSIRPLVGGILLAKGIIAGGAIITFTGHRMNVYPLLGAFFRANIVIDLYGYAQLNSLAYVTSFLCFFNNSFGQFNFF